MPVGWAWCRLTNVAITELGKTLDAKKNKGESYDYLCALNVKWYTFDFTTLKQIRLEEKEKERYLVRKGDLLICEGGDVGRSAIWESDNPIYYQNALHRVRFYQNINQYFFLHVLNYYKNIGLIDDVSGGVTIKHFTQNSMQKLLFPLPPLAEQERIVSVIKSIFSQIDTLDQNKSDLQTAIKQTKSKILDLAIHGKLVPQEPNDEPAEELLKRIATSDNRPYKKFAEEKPFDIPKSWAWCTGNDLFNSMTSKKPDGETFRYIDIDAIDNKKHCVIEPKSLSVSEAPSRASRELNNGDVLFSLVRPYLENIALIEEENSDCIASTGFYVCKPKSNILPKFLFYLMTTDYVIKGLNQFMKGDNSPSVSGDDIKNWLYPLPPLAEQRRIVAKIETLFKQLDSIQNEIIS